MVNMTLERGVLWLEDGTEVSDVSIDLLKAAPSLLKALKRIINDSPEPGEDAVLTVEGYNQACEAIAIAEGS